MRKRSSKKKKAQEAFDTANAQAISEAAAALGRLGGLKGGRARADKLTAQQRHTIAVKAANARWKKAKNE